MTQRFLYMRRLSADHAGVAVFQEIDGEMIQIGDDFGVGESSASENGLAQNRVIHWGNDLYAINQDFIYKYDVANPSGWNAWYTFANPRVGDIPKMCKLGFTTASVEGSGVLVCGYVPVTANRIRFVLIDKDLNVTEDEHIVTFAATDNRTILANSALLHRNSVFFKLDNQGGGATVIYEYNIKEKTLAGLSPSNGIGIRYSNAQMCIVNDNLYDCGYPVFGFGPPKLRRKSGTFMVEIAAIGSQEHANTDSPWVFGSAMTEIDGKLYFINPGGANGDGRGWQAFEITLDADGDYASHVNITSGILPADLISTNNTKAGSVIRIDNVTNSGIDPIYEMVLHKTGSQGVSSFVYRWNNAPTGMFEFVAHTLDDQRFSRISTNNGTGGGQIWSGSGTLNASQPCLTVVGANIDAEFVIYGAGQSGVALELLFDKGGGNPQTIGTIVSATAGNVVGNRVENLVADGVTKVTVRWAAAIDGITEGDHPKLAAQVFIP